MRIKLENIILLLLLIVSSQAFCQDTVFVKRHLFGERVRNVFEVHDIVHVKTNSKIYKLESDNFWAEVDNSIKERYAIYDDGRIIGRDQLNRYKSAVDKGFYKLLPVRNFHAITSVAVGNSIYATAAGSLFEYHVNDHYLNKLPAASIRSIYPVQDSIYIGAYGAFHVVRRKIINNKREYFFSQFDKPAFMNGRIVKHMGRTFLCADRLKEFLPNGELKDHDAIYKFEHGDKRDLVTFKGDLYSLNTKSITRYDSLTKNMVTVASGYTYTTIEVAEENLYFGTISGELFKLNHKDAKAQLVLKLDSEITDLHPLFDKLYITDFANGVYVADKTNVADAELLFNLPQVVSIISDNKNKLWVGTEDGLYMSNEDQGDLRLYIPSVEFNRYATARRADLVFFGATTGLYIIGGEMADSYLRKLSNDPITRNGKVDTIYLYFSLVVIFLLLMVIIFFVIRNRKREIKDHSPTLSSLTVDKMSETIVKNNIQSVEQLAEHYNTNPVQLHRMLKGFDLTPGKLLRQVKLEIANEMKEQGDPIEQISNATGYSVNYLLNHWKTKSTK